MLDFLLENNTLSAFVAFGVVLIPAVFIHEVGHFLAAKAVGISILEFGIGFPPRARRLFTWRGTEFTLNYLPLGGFVRPLGEDMIRPISEEEIERDRQNLIDREQAATEVTSDPLNITEDAPAPIGLAVHEAQPLARILFMAAGAMANFASAFLLFVVIALLGVPQIAPGPLAAVYVEPNSTFAASGIQSGDFILEINATEFEGADDFYSRLAELEDGQTATLTIFRAADGERETISFLPAINHEDHVRDESVVRIQAISPESPAQGAGILPDDLILTFDGEPLASVNDLVIRTRANAGREIALTLQRGASTLEVNLVPRENPPPGQGALGVVVEQAFRDTGNGLVYQTVAGQTLVPQPLGEAISYGVQRSISVVELIVGLPAQLVQGTTSVETARPVSVVGISQVGGRALQESIEDNRPVVILNFIAMISIALGLTNLLPLPALDGGRIVFVVVELIRGHPIAPEREGMVHLVGLAVLLSITVVFILNDLINPITNSIP